MLRTISVISILMTSISAAASAWAGDICYRDPEEFTNISGMLVEYADLYSSAQRLEGNKSFEEKRAEYLSHSNVCAETIKLALNILSLQEITKINKNSTTPKDKIDAAKYYPQKASFYKKSLEQINAMSSLYPDAIAELAMKLQLQWDDTLSRNHAQFTSTKAKIHWSTYLAVMALGGIESSQNILTGPVGRATNWRGLLGSLILQGGGAGLSQPIAKLQIRNAVFPAPFEIIRLSIPSRANLIGRADALELGRNFTASSVAGMGATLAARSTSKWFKVPAGARFLRRFGHGVGGFVLFMAVDMSLYQLTNHLLETKHADAIKSALARQISGLVSKTDTRAQRLWRVRAIMDLAQLWEIHYLAKLLPILEKVGKDNFTEKSMQEFVSNIQSQLKSTRVSFGPELRLVYGADLIRTGNESAAIWSVMRSTVQSLTSRAQAAKDPIRELGAIELRSFASMAKNARAGNLAYTDVPKLYLQLFSLLMELNDPLITSLAETQLRDRALRFARLLNLINAVSQGEI